MRLIKTKENKQIIVRMRKRILLENHTHLEDTGKILKSNLMPINVKSSNKMEKISRNNNLEKVTHKKVTHEEMENLNSPLNIKEIESVSIYIFIYLKLKYS